MTAPASLSHLFIGGQYFIIAVYPTDDNHFEARDTAQKERSTRDI
jgi:hypothetical protein